MGPIPEVNIDQLAGPESLRTEVTILEEKRSPVVVLTSSLEHMDLVRSALCALRASNISTVLLLRRSEVPWEEEELEILFGFLRDWDQLLLHNILESCGDFIPKEFLPALQVEAKTELKWFKEWQQAIVDPRIHKYPGLPWRAFIRKVNSENYRFISSVLKKLSLPSSFEVNQDLKKEIFSFLEAKKKVLCVFPKNWGGGNA